MWKAGEREREVTINSDSHSPLWIKLLEKWCHQRPPQFSKRKLPSFTLSCSSSSTKHCFPANKMRHNFLHAVCGDSVISLAGSQAHTGQELQRALYEAPSLQGFSFISLGLWFFFFSPVELSDSPLFIYSFIYLLVECRFILVPSNFR